MKWPPVLCDHSSFFPWKVTQDRFDCSYIITLYMFLKGFSSWMHQNIIIKNKWTINNVYLYIGTHPFRHLWHSCLFCVLLINLLTVKEIDHPVNTPTKCGSKWQNGFREENKGRHWGWTTSDGNFSLFETDQFLFLAIWDLLILH